MQEVMRAWSGKGSGSKGRLIDLPTCHHAEVKFRCGFWKWQRNPEKIEWNAQSNYVPSSSSQNPSSSSSQNPSKNPSKSPSKKSVQKKPSKNPSKKFVPKLHPKICHFVIAIVPIGFVSPRPVLKTSTSSLNVFMGSMAMSHEGCLQCYICSRDGQIEAKINPKPLVPRLCENASTTVQGRQEA